MEAFGSERLEGGQDLAPVKQADVLRLNRGQAADRPGQVHEVWLEGRPQRMHAGLFGQKVALARVTRAAGSEDVGPGVRAPTRQRHQVVTRQALPVPQLGLAAPAE